MTMTDSILTREHDRDHVHHILTGETWAMEPRAYVDLLGAFETAGRQAGGFLSSSGRRQARPRAEPLGPVAVVDIRGPIFRYPNILTRLFISTCIEDLAKELRAAVDDPAVKSILLNVDSSGGQLSGIHETAEMIFKARRAKPVAAYVGGTAAAGAYWLTAAAETVVVDATAGIGSIGVSAVFIDQRKARERVGIRDIEIVSSASPKKRPDPATDKGREQIRAHLDALADVFISSMATYRGVSADKVRADFGRGDLLVGANAVKAGLADRLGSYEGTSRELREGRLEPAGKPESMARKPQPQTQPKSERREPMIEVRSNETTKPAQGAQGLSDEEVLRLMVKAGNSSKERAEATPGKNPEVKDKDLEEDELLKAMVEGANSVRL